MTIELKRFIRSAYLAVAVGISALFFIGGYGWQMPAYPDGVTYSALFEGVYTVYCQFGQLILSAFAMFYITNDYSNKNVLFYRELGFNSTRYYLCKVTTMALALITSFGLCSLAACAVYGDFSLLIGMLLQVSALIIAYLSVFCCVALVVGKFVPSFFAYIVWWIGASIAVGNGPDWMQWLQFFDQNADLYRTTIDHFANISSFLSNQAQAIGTCFAYSLALLIVGTLISYITRKRWLHNGV